MARDHAGGHVRSPQVVVATGYENDPFIPDWPGRDRFDGELLHARDYKRPAPYAGKRVLVVGPGCTGMEIAFDLAGAVPARFGSPRAHLRTSCCGRVRPACRET